MDRGTVNDAKELISRIRRERCVDDHDEHDENADDVEKALKL
jgi:hypothetical protein